MGTDRLNVNGSNQVGDLSGYLDIVTIGVPDIDSKGGVSIHNGAKTEKPVLHSKDNTLSLESARYPNSLIQVVRKTGSGGSTDAELLVEGRDYSISSQTITITKQEKRSGDFEVTYINKKDNKISKDIFDFVVVSTGHFSVPFIPEYPGMKSFPGRIMHSHDFRDAEEFRNKDVIVLGSSYSAEDVALQCNKYGAKSVTIGYRHNPMGFKWPKGMKEVHYLDRLEGKKAIFKDGTEQNADVVILCTGYLHHFPFLEENLKLKTNNRLYPPKLYKGVVWQDNHKLLYLGMQDQFHTFNMFDCQAWYARDVIMGKIKIPNDKEIENDINKWVALEEKLENPDQMIDFQTEYTKELHEMSDYPKIDFELIRKHFKEWEHHKVEDILTYRNKSFSSPVTGSVAPIHHTPWETAMDDSMKTFLNK